MLNVIDQQDFLSRMQHTLHSPADPHIPSHRIRQRLRGLKACCTAPKRLRQVETTLVRNLHVRSEFRKESGIKIRGNRLREAPQEAPPFSRPLLESTPLFMERSASTAAF